MKNIAVLIVMLSLFLGYSGSAFSCVGPHYSHPGELVNTDIVFKGVVTEVKYIKRPPDMQYDYEDIAVVKYKVVKTYKGPKAEFHHRLFYKLSKGQGDWGNIPSVGAEFIIGAWKWEYHKEIGALNKYEALDIPDHYCHGSYVYRIMDEPINTIPSFSILEWPEVYEKHIEYIFRKELNLDKKDADKIREKLLIPINKILESKNRLDDPHLALAYLASLRDPETLHLLIENLKNDWNYDIQHYALNVLGASNVREIIPVLEYFKNDHDYIYTRKEAGKALAELKKNLLSYSVTIENRKKLDSAIADFLIHKARQKIISENDNKASKLLKDAFAHKPALKHQQELIWLESLLSSAMNIIRNRNRKRDPEGHKKFLERLTKRVDQIFSRLETIENPPENIRANAYFFRGVIHSYKSDYSSAIKEFKTAENFQKQTEITHWLFAARVGEARKIAESKPLEGLIITSKLLTGLAPEDRKKIGMKGNSLNSSVRFLYYAISHLYYEQAVGQAQNNRLITECDKLAGHDLDIYKVASGVEFQKIKTDKALPACRHTLSKEPENARFMLNLSRAHVKAAEEAFRSGDKKLAEKHYREVAKLLETAMKMNYPYAFNNMAHYKDHGINTSLPKALQKDRKQAASLYIQTFNRIIRCCWLPVAKHIVKHRRQHDPKAIRDILGKYTKWAVALNVKGAGEYLNDLQKSGILLKKIDISKIKKADYNSLPNFMIDSKY